jgi:hypothetical protein
MSAAQPASEQQAQGLEDASGLSVAGLRERGAQHVDPAGFRYLEALSRRAEGHQGAVKQALDARLALAVAAYDLKFKKAGNASEQPASHRDVHPHRGPLGELVDYIEQLAGAQDPTHPGEAASQPSAGAALAELKTLRQFRKTWTSLSVDRQMSRSKEKVPENPGPLNSHLLVLRSLQLMQETSPAYLNRFMAHVESLFWLDQASFGGLPTQGKTVLRQSEKKRKPGRGKTGP